MNIIFFKKKIFNCQKQKKNKKKWEHVQFVENHQKKKNQTQQNTMK